MRRVAELWRQRREANAGDARFSISVTAPTNADARAVALALRQERRTMGELGADVISLRATDQAGAAYTLTLAPGDRVRLFDRLNARFLDGGRGNIGNNGSVLEVRDVNAEGIVLRTAAGRDGLVPWKNLADKHSGRMRLAPGDVLTIDAAQGITSSEHINAMPAGSAGVQGFKGYTAESRHKDAAWLITSDGAERREVMARRALGDARPVGTADVWENVARNLARQPAKASALDFMERARDVGRGTTHAMQAGFRRAEARKRPARRGRRWRGSFGSVEGRVIGEVVERLRQALDARWQAVRALAGRLRQAGRPVLQDGGREDRRPAKSGARAVCDRARANQARSQAAAERHRAPHQRQDAQSQQEQPLSAATYWQRVVAGKNGTAKPSLRRAARRKREDSAVAAVVDRLALAMDERGAVLAGIGQGRGQQEHQHSSSRPPFASHPRARDARCRSSGAASAAALLRGRRRGGLRYGAAPRRAARERASGDGWDAAPRRRRGRPQGAEVGKLCRASRWLAGGLYPQPQDRNRDPLEGQSARGADDAGRTRGVRGGGRGQVRRAARARHDIQERAAKMAQRLWAASAPAIAHLTSPPRACNRMGCGRTNAAGCWCQCGGGRPALGRAAGGCGRNQAVPERR
ncbi:hypothetical protein ACFQU7_35625 [Pseudoroseomonas wenyumeiae]